MRNNLPQVDGLERSQSLEKDRIGSTGGLAEAGREDEEEDAETSEERGQTLSVKLWWCYYQ